MESAAHVYYALCAEGYDHETALRATWDAYEAIEAQRAAYVKGVRE
jgi:hypothetical protein